MKFGLDTYAHLDSRLHRWEPRAKLVGLLVLIFAFAFVKSLWLLLPMLVVTAAIFYLSHLPFSFLRTRLKMPGIFLLTLVLSFVFLVGSTPLIAWGPVAIRAEGVTQALLVAVRFVCIITLSIVLFGTATFVTSIKAMRALGLPELMTDMILLTYRYLFEMSYMLATTRTAVRLRGFQGNQFKMETLSVLAAVIGNLLVRSYEQADRVYHAMILRGYGHLNKMPHEFQTQRSDLLAAAAVVVIALLFVAAQLYLDVSI